MAQYDTERGCPKCGGHEGYQFDLVEKHIMGAGWGELPVSIDSGIIVSRSLVKCIECGHRFRLDTLRALGAIGGEVDEGEGE